MPLFNCRIWVSSLIFIPILVKLGEADEARHTTVAISVSGKDRRETILPGYLASWGHDLTSPVSGPINSVTPADACSNVQSTHNHGSVLVIDQGKCTFAEKMANLQQFMPAAVVVIGSVSLENWIIMGPNNITSSSPGVMVLHEDGQTLKQYQSAVLSGYVRAVFDWSSVVLIVVATLIVFTSSYWATERDRNKKRGIVTSDPDVPDEGITNISATTAGLFIIIASVTLITLYYFIDKLIYVLIGIFAISGTSSLTIVLAHPARKLAPKLDRYISVPIVGSINLLYSVLLALCIPATCCWISYRKSYYAFIMQDILGASLLIMMQRVTRMSSIKIASILLVSAFVYDIFWVFLSPLIFKSSVMISVATGGSTGEVVPMLLAFPKFNDIFRGFSLIGLGDLALPGLFITFTFRFDAFNETFYSRLAMGGYVLGLILTSIAIALMKMGQPALLYLVPCTLGLVSLIAWWKGHLSQMWQGINEECGSDRERLKNSDDQLSDVSLSR